jgi:hypothetical protein
MYVLYIDDDAARKAISQMDAEDFAKILFALYGVGFVTLRSLGSDVSWPLGAIIRYVLFGTRTRKVTSPNSLV